MTDDALTRDAFLGGRLSILQPKTGYRAGIDAVLLAAATPAAPGQSVLDLGCGVGVAALCLGARVPGLTLAGLELQEDYAALARRNAATNGMDLEVFTGDVARLPAALRQRRFDHVIVNPPYFRAATRTAARDAGRETAHAGPAPLQAWIDTATRRLLPGGRLTVIQRMDRLPDLMKSCDGRLGSIVLHPLQPRAGRPPHLALLAAKKGGRAAFAMMGPTILHKGDRHEYDIESYTESIRGVLRDAMPLI
ncbi:tRNA1(Val) (adenine(37)-N6)-methyltransferase [Oceaniglobus roseus]|uniref:tRNA1(Val) (adenine(37)-N6)-methyltransferase n=1 Tax=Oceaniglobus roseus TaxID=1737570 RepID=UPI000C7EFF01|nr:methyltransferase [Kandeliimicrobium roseum]